MISASHGKSRIPDNQTVKVDKSTQMKLFSLLCILASVALAQLQDRDTNCAQMVTKCGNDEYVDQMCALSCYERVQEKVIVKVNATSGNNTDTAKYASKCVKWAKRGYCLEKHVSFMKSNCGKTCSERSGDRDVLAWACRYTATSQVVQSFCRRSRY